MEYKDLRFKFAQLSGRYDLVNDDLTDAGADFFINAGQKMLDRSMNTGKMIGKSVQSVAAGTAIVKCTGLRAVKGVWIGTTATGLTKLIPYPLDVLRNFYESSISTIDQGAPVYYSPAVFRPIPDTQLAAGWSGYYDIDDLLLANNHYTYNGILLWPTPDQTYYVSISALFYSPTLTATLLAGTWTQTKSYWSEVHEDLLLYASLYKLESFYRNTEGVKDWKGVLGFDLGELDKDAAEEEGADINEMGG